MHFLKYYYSIDFHVTILKKINVEESDSNKFHICMNLLFHAASEMLDFDVWENSRSNIPERGESQEI